ncbi:MAG: hypothetical protein QOJ07_557 [Thermoleophilaceae bacterium]|nr:hypothetical protein [Thermoleophilaceae bacterium]
MADYDRNEVEARLKQRLEEIATARRAVRGEEEDDEAARDGELADYDQHPGDSGTDTLEQEMDETKLIILDQEQSMVEQAMERLAAGTYGTCVDCGKEIPPARLEVHPEAIRCVEDQARYEATHGAATGPGPAV